MRVCFRYGCSFFRLEALTNVLPIGKEQGSKTTLPAMLKKCSDELSAEFSVLSKSEKDALLANCLQAKEEKSTAKRLSNVAISKVVESKMRLVTSTVCSHFIFAF
jgi:hypothetical protein